MTGFWEVMRRSEDGPLTKERDVDMALGLAARRLAHRYEIHFHPDRVVPADDGLADRLFAAGLDLFLETGIYCRDTGRLIRFDRSEVLAALRHAPVSVTHGQGRDTAVMTARKVEDARPPFCSFTPVGTPVAEERFVALVQSYAQEPLARTFSSAFSQTVNGRPIKARTPQEVEAAIWNVIKLREAARAAGRPQIGIHNLISNAEATDAVLAAMQPAFGVLPNDGLGIAAIAELKVDHERLKKVVFLRHSGHNKYGLYGPLMGGFAGGPETTAIVHVAYHFLGLLAFEAQWHCGFPLHIHQGCNTTAQMLWLISLTTQALSRNTHLPLSVSPFAAAGPCTEMVVYEMAAAAIAATVSGANLLPAAVARNRHPERVTAMEARIAAHVGHAVAGQGLDRAGANEIVKGLLALYEDQIPTAPLGLRFDQCYDLDRLEPTGEYRNLVARCRDTIAGLGFDIGEV